MTEKRRFSRIGIQVAAELKVQEAVLKIERLENLSIGGCLLQTSQDFAQGSSCRLTISLDGSIEKILVTGVIARSEPGRIGSRPALRGGGDCVVASPGFTSAARTSPWAIFDCSSGADG